MAEYNKSEWIVVGISGVTCGGKSTLASRLAATLAPVFVFNQDHYFYPDDSPHHVRCSDIPHNNYDILSALDMAAMRRDVITTLAGDTRPAHTHSLDGPVRARGRKFLIVEGFTVLNYKPIADLCDLKYYLVLELGECQMRRSLRVYDPPDVPGYFDTCVWPEHLKYKKEIMLDRTVRVLSGADPDNMDHILEDLRHLGAGEQTGTTQTAPQTGNLPVLTDTGNTTTPCLTLGAPAGHTTSNDIPSTSERSPRGHGAAGCDNDTCLLDSKCHKNVYP